MFRVDWGVHLKVLGWVITAIVLCVFIIGSYLFGYDLGEDAGNSAYSADYHDNYAVDRIERECLGTKPPGFELHECIQEQVKTSYEHQTAYNDLKSQRRMAFWAVLMGVFTGLTVLVTGVGVIFIAMTLKTTNSMLGEARKTTDAAFAAARVSEAARIDQLKGIEVQNRAWIKFDLQFKTAQKDEGGVSIGMDCMLENLGVTPATDISLQIELMSISQIIRGGDDFFDIARAEYTNKIRGFHGVDAFPNKSITIPYSGWVRYSGTGPTDPVEFAISICYRSAFSDTPHQTGGFFKILQIPEDGTRVFRDEPIFPSIVHHGINT